MNNKYISPNMELIILKNITTEVHNASNSSQTSTEQTSHEELGD